MKNVFLGLVGMTIVALLVVNVATAKESPNPFRELWDAINEIRQQIASIQLMSGSSESKNDIGSQGSARRDIAGLHLYDANNQNLGVLLDAYYHTFLASQNAIIQIHPHDGSLILKHTIVYFDNIDCTGQAFGDPLSQVNRYETLDTPTPTKYFVGTGVASTSPNLLSFATSSVPGGCINIQPFQPSQASLLQPIVLPFMQPLATPLSIR